MGYWYCQYTESDYILKGKTWTLRNVLVDKIDLCENYLNYHLIRVNSSFDTSEPDAETFYKAVATLKKILQDGSKYIQ